jgi:hypothetical protein
MFEPSVQDAQSSPSLESTPTNPQTIASLSLSESLHPHTQHYDYLPLKDDEVRLLDLPLWIDAICINQDDLLSGVIRDDDVQPLHATEQVSCVPRNRGKGKQGNHRINQIDCQRKSAGSRVTAHFTRGTCVNIE